MKRFSVLFAGVLLAMIVPVAAFAQLSFGGYYRAGGIYVAPASGTSTLTFSDRLRLNVAFASANDLYGFKFRLQGNGSTSGPGAGGSSGIYNAFTNAGTLQYGFGYMTFLDKKLKLSAGVLDVTDYEVAQHVGNLYLGNVFTDETKPGSPVLGGEKGNTTGAMAQLEPVTGLSIGIYSRIAGTDLSVSDLGIAASYVIPNTGKIIVDSSLGNYASASNDIGKSRVTGVFSFTGVKGLSATAGVRYDGHTAFGNANNGAIGALAIVEYTTGPLFLDLAADLDLTNSAQYVESEVDYKIISPLTLRAYGAYDSSALYAKAGSTGAAVANNEMIGADLVIPFTVPASAGSPSTSAELDAGIVYGNKSNIGVPVLVKVNF